MRCPTAFICNCTELITVTGRRWRRSKQLLDDSKERRGHWNLKDKTFNGTLWRTAFGRDYGDLLRHIIKLINSFRRIADLLSLVPRLNCDEFHLHSSKSSLRASSMKTNLRFSRKKRCCSLDNLCNRNSLELGGWGHLEKFLYQCLLTWPLTRGFLLLVNFSLSKATTPWAIQSWPVAGESGWTYKLWPSGGSPEPATIHWELETELHSYITYVVQTSLLSLTIK